MITERTPSGQTTTYWSNLPPLRLFPKVLALAMETLEFLLSPVAEVRLFCLRVNLTEAFREGVKSTDIAEMSSVNFLRNVRTPSRAEWRTWNVQMCVIWDAYRYKRY